MGLMRALAAAACDRLGVQHPFVAACRDGDLTTVRALLDSLEPAEADALLAAAHKRLREERAGLLAQWSPDPGFGPN